MRYTATQASRRTPIPPANATGYPNLPKASTAGAGNGRISLKPASTSRNNTTKPLMIRPAQSALLEVEVFSVEKLAWIAVACILFVSYQLRSGNLLNQIASRPQPVQVVADGVAGMDHQLGSCELLAVPQIPICDATTRAATLRGE